MCSVAAIVFCTLLTAFCFASVLHPWGIRQLGGLLLMPGFLGLGLTQYAATFQSKANRAETAARLYSLGSGFAFIALVCVLLDLYRMGEPMSWPVAGLAGLLLLFATWGRWGGRLNRQWAAELRAWQEETASDQDGSEAPVAGPADRRLLRFLFPAIFVAATWVFYLWMGPRFGEHLSADQTPLALPQGASDVCYWIYAGTTAFEFSISEDEFLRWSEQQIARRRNDFKGLEPIGARFAMPRYRQWLPNAPPPHDVVIGGGYHYGWRQRGRNVDYAYDAAAGRAYYCSVADSL
ncbi:MAG: hypothetical protein GXY25_21845 [Pirellulaceae bacterium]|nr:hypothetical protein [Thermoguttaceae bacterium]MDI9445809.1 hypothetical protein [Planctomycetota bacterium]NLZ03167.1 hypothetical protein [Pirellulaceae bacterium]